MGLTQLASKPPTGKSIVYLADTLAPTDVMNGQAAVAAAKLLGWHAQTIGYAGDPASLATALQQAVADKPTAVLISGQDAAAFSSALKAADRGRCARVRRWGSRHADRDGRRWPRRGLARTEIPEHARVRSAPIGSSRPPAARPTWPSSRCRAFNTLVAEDKGFTTELKSQCKSCTVTTVNAQLTDIGKDLPQLVVSAVQSNPSINYLFFPYGDTADGVAPALKTAGYSPKIVASIADASTYSELKYGTLAMNVATSPQVQGS